MTTRIKFCERVGNLFLGLMLALAWGSSPLQAQDFNPLGLPGLGGGNTPEELIQFSAEYRLGPDRKDGTLSVTAKLQPTWHVYSTTQKAGGPQASRLKLADDSPVELLRPFVADRAPLVKPAEIFPVPSEEFAEQVVWSAPIRVTSSGDAEQLSITILFNGQVCQDEGSCVPISNVSIPAKFAGERPAETRGAFTAPRVHATIRGSISPRSATPGSTVQLTLTAEPAPNYHVYALAERDPMIVSKPALIVLTQKPDWIIGSPQASDEPVEHPGPAEEPVQRYYEKSVTWTIPIQIPEDAAPAGYRVEGLIGYQVCTSSSCDRPAAAQFSATIEVAKSPAPSDSDPEPLTFVASNYNVAAKAAEERPATGGASDIASPTRSPPRLTEATAPPAPSLENYDGPLLEIAKLQPGGSEETEKQSLFIVLPTALLAGFILNFMPCVLPVIGLKIVSFVQQAGQSRSRIFLLNLWYCFGLLSVFMILATLAVFAEFSWGKQFQSATFNIVLASVVFAFGLSFLGVWEIPLPGFVGSSEATTKVADQEGPAGAFAKGVLTTILATPCSGPLLIPALAWALKQPPVLTYAAFFCVGLGMAAPYLIVGMFPRLVSFLPKPGAWMETFKQVMGFVLLGTVVYLLTFIRMPLVVPTVAFMVGLWAALWWIGRVPVWDELNKRLRAWAFGAAFATGIGMLAFNWLNYEMEARFNRDVAAAAYGGSTLDPSQIRGTVAENTTDLRWKPYSLPLLSKYLLEEKKTVFIDFTADWCPNCKVNEKFALNVPQTKQFVEANGIETIKADMTYEAPAIEALLKQLAGSAAIPVYAVFDPRDPYHPKVMEGIVTKSRVIEALAEASPNSPTKLAATTSPATDR